MAATDREGRESLLRPHEGSSGVNDGHQNGSNDTNSPPASPGEQGGEVLRFRGGRVLLVTTAALLLIAVGTFGLTYSYAARRYFLSTEPPTCRKSAAAVVISGLKLGEGSDSPRLKGQQLLIWSGKGHHLDLMFDDLRALDLRTGGWHRLYDRTNKAGNNSDPEPRWKAVAVFDRSLPGLVVSGGDAGQKQLPHNGYLSDMWWLPTNVSLPVWQQPVSKETGVDVNKSQAAGEPGPRRAHAGAILAVPGQATQLIIHGGKAPNGHVMADVWTAELTRKAFVWTKLFSPRGATVAGQAYPSPRKGHIAAILPGAEPLLFIYGGRNDTQYFKDAWVFNLASHTWTEWPAQGVSPKPRDHMGSFYFQGLVYIYGGRGGSSYKASKPMNDIWAFNVTSHMWTQIVPTGVQPKARFLYSLAFYSTGDASNALLSDDDVGANDGRMLIFGGEGRDGCYMNDVWEFSLSSSRWREVSADRPCQKHCLHKKDKPESEEQDESMFNAQLAMQEVRKVLRQV